jgi:hypothetical protein
MPSGASSQAESNDRVEVSGVEMSQVNGRASASGRPGAGGQARTGNPAEVNDQADGIPEATVARLRAETPRLDALVQSKGWKLLGGTELFRLYDTPDAAAAQEGLARHQIWTRMFAYSNRWLRLGLPGPAAEWDRLAKALRD